MRQGDKETNPTSVPVSPGLLVPLSSHYPSHPPPVRVSLVTLPEHPCPYIPGRAARSRAFMASSIAPPVYHALMDAAFRRSGRLVYQPVCAGCRACVPIRVPVATFEASKSQRRAVRRNVDLNVAVAAPEATQEKFELYRRYQRDWHGKSGDDLEGDDEEGSWASFVSFLYDSPVDTVEFTYRDAAGKLLGVGICDVAAGQSLSSVYFYHEPAESKRGLGTFSAVYEIESARSMGVPYYYLGYWIAGCGAMAYKANFRPYELLGTDGVWRIGE